MEDARYACPSSVEGNVAGDSVDVVTGWIDDRVDAVIFDHDGTLVDSETITLNLLATMAVEAGADIRDGDIDRFTGADLAIVLDEIEGRRGARLDRDAFLEDFRVRQSAEIRSGLREVEGARAILGALHGASIPTAVASNAPIAKMELCLDAADLRRFFDDHELVSAYTVDAWKPDPAVFLAAADVLGVDPGRCAVVEDSLPGIDGAMAAGMHVIALDPNDRFTTRATKAVPSLAAAQIVLLGEI